MAMRKCLIFFMALSMLFVQIPVQAFATGADLTVAAENGADGGKGHDQTLKAENGENGGNGGNGETSSVFYGGKNGADGADGAAGADQVKAADGQDGADGQQLSLKSPGESFGTIAVTGGDGGDGGDGGHGGVGGNGGNGGRGGNGGDFNAFSVYTSGDGGDGGDGGTSGESGTGSVQVGERGKPPTRPGDYDEEPDPGYNTGMANGRGGAEHFGGGGRKGGMMRDTSSVYSFNTGNGGDGGIGGAGGDGGAAGEVGLAGDASLTVEGGLCTPEMTVAGRSGNVSVSIDTLFVSEDMTLNISTGSSADIGSVGDVSVSIGMLYIDGEMTINFSGLPADSVVIDQVVMPADSMLTFKRNGGEKITIHELYTTQSSVLIGLDYAVITNGVTVYEPIVKAARVERLGPSEAAVTFTSDETSTYYYMVSDRWMKNPPIDTSGDGELCIADEETTLHLTGLSRGKLYVYIAVKDILNAVSYPVMISIPAYLHLPQTGDSSHPGGWAVLMIGSLCGLTALMVCRRRQDRAG